jgi:hypothetical protein
VNADGPDASFLQLVGEKPIAEEVVGVDLQTDVAEKEVVSADTQVPAVVEAVEFVKDDQEVLEGLLDGPVPAVMKLRQPEAPGQQGDQSLAEIPQAHTLIAMDGGRISGR